jgi:hypothetical protein
VDYRTKAKHEELKKMAETFFISTDITIDDYKLFAQEKRSRRRMLACQATAAVTQAMSTV